MFSFQKVSSEITLHDSVTRLGEDWFATSWPPRGSKYLEFFFRWLLNADLLEAAAALVFTVEFSWSTVEMIAQASDDIIKVVQK